MALEVGKIVEGRVTGITSFGAFIELPDGSTGLVHISEVAREYVTDIKEHLKDKQTVRVKILSIEEKGKISLSIKRALEEEQPRSTSRPIDIDWSHRNDMPLSFEDMLNRFKIDSEEKMQAIKKNFEPKKGSYRRSSHTY